MKKIKIGRYDIITYFSSHIFGTILYFIISSLCCLFSSWIYIVFRVPLAEWSSPLPRPLYYAIILLFALMTFVLFVGLTYLCSRKIIRSHYVESEDPFLWVKSLLLFVLPAELIRMTICTVLVCYIGAQLINYYAFFLYDILYLSVDRMASIYQELAPTPADRIAFLGCCLLFLLLYLPAFAFLYRRGWLAGKRDREQFLIDLKGTN